MMSDDITSIYKHLSSIDRGYIGRLVTSGCVYSDVYYDKYGIPTGFIILNKDLLNMTPSLYCVIGTIIKRKGIGLELLVKALRWFLISKYEQLLWISNVNNIASINLAKKVGFTYGWKRRYDEDVYILTNPKNFIRLLGKK